MSMDDDTQVESGIPEELDGEIDKKSEDLEFLGVFEKPPPNILANITISDSSESESVQDLEREAQLEKRRKVLRMLYDGSESEDSGNTPFKPYSRSKSSKIRKTSRKSLDSSPIRAGDIDKINCRDFLVNIIKKSARGKGDITRCGKNKRKIRRMIQDLIDGSLLPEHFAMRLKEFRIRYSATGCQEEALIKFLKDKLPQLRREMTNGVASISGINPPLFS